MRRIIEQFKNIFAIVYRNRRTSFAGLICTLATWFYAQQQITTEEYLSLLGFCISLGLFLSKDGQTTTEYDKEHTKRTYKKRKVC